MVSVTIFLVLAFVVFILLVFAFRSSGSSREEVIKPVRGDELAVWPFEPMPIMTPTEVISHPRASSQERLTELLPRYFNSVSIFEDLNLATQSVIDQSQDNDLILVCGSFYTISGVLTSQSLSE